MFTAPALLRKVALSVILTVTVLFGWPANAEDPTPVKSRITEVTVYPEWGYVTRQADLDLPAGRTRIAIDKLPSWIDDESIRARVEGAANCTIVGVSTKTTFLTKSSREEVRIAQAKVTKLSDLLEDLQSELGVHIAEKDYLTGLKAWKLNRVPQETAVRPVSIEELRAVQEFITSGLLANHKKTATVRRKIRELQPRLQAESKTWNSLRSHVRLEQKAILIDLDAKAATKGRLVVSYLISGASWYPTYDARADADRKRIQLTCKAIVQQSTSEDWSNVRVQLSTIRPDLTVEKPDLKPWYVDVSSSRAVLAQTSGYSFRSSAGKRGAQLRAVQQKQRASYANDAFNRLALQQVQGNLALAREAIKQIEERGTTAEFQIGGTFSIPADGKPVAVPIGATDLVSDNRYSAIPPVSKSTYVMGAMRNTGTFPFLPGTANVYIGGSFIGKSKMGLVAQGERFEMYLGLEERIKVSRELNAQNSSTSTFGGKKRLEVTYDIKVSNFLKTSATIEIRDQIPVSQNKSIRVRLIRTEPRPSSNEKGILTWVVTLAPNESTTLSFGFRMDYPAGTNLGQARAVEAQVRARRR